MDNAFFLSFSPGARSRSEGLHAALNLDTAYSFPSQSLLQQLTSNSTVCSSSLLRQGGLMLIATHDVSNDALEPLEKVFIDQVIAERSTRPGALLGILEEVQASNAHKFLSISALHYVARQTGIPPARVYSAATFYALSIWIRRAIT